MALSLFLGLRGSGGQGSGSGVMGAGAASATINPLPTTLSATDTLNVGILIMPGIFISEATIPFDMYMHVPDKKMNTYFVASTMDPVWTYYGTRLKPDFTFDTAPIADVLVIPSGIGSFHQYLTAWYGGEVKADGTIEGKTQNNKPVTYYGNMTSLIDWVTAASANATIVTSHCWGAFTLADAGVLDGKVATTFPGYTADLDSNYPAIASVVSDKRWVIDGKVMTSNGALAAFEACLTVIRHIYGETVADGIVSGLVLSPQNVGHSKDEYFKPSPTKGTVENVTTAKVAILLLEGTYISEPTAPFDIFAHLGSNVQVYFVGETMDPIKTYYKATMYPDYAVADAPDADIIVLPSGSFSRGSDRMKPAVINWIKAAAPKAKWVTSHCWGAFLLCEAGLCDGKTVTTFPGYFDELKSTFPAIGKVVNDSRIVQDGKLVTSNGGVAAYEAANYVIMKHWGVNRAKKVATGLVFSADNWAAQENALEVTMETSGATCSAALLVA
jgi:transcriptional regulator GlxA family with amidase domain